MHDDQHRCGLVFWILRTDLCAIHLPDRVAPQHLVALLEKQAALEGSAQPDMAWLAILKRDFRHVEIALRIVEASVFVLGPIRRHGIGRSVTEPYVEHNVSMLAQDD